MRKTALIFVYVFSFALSYYLPIKKKSIDFGDDICKYTDPTHDNLYTYVRGCPEGNYCASVDSSSFDVHKCVPSTEVIKRLGDECKVDLDCDGNLYCINNVCSIKDGQPYWVGTNKYCPSGQIYNSTSDSVTQNQHMHQCINKATNTDKCYIVYEGSTGNTLYSNTYEPDYFKICGKMNFRLDSSVSTNKYYKHLSTEMNYIGEVEDGNVVANKKACKSGYALSLYANGGVTKPFSDSEVSSPSNGNSKDFLTCVTVKEVQYSSSSGTLNCRIKFTKGSQDEYVYDQDISGCDEFLLTKLEIFQKYVERMNAIRDDCETNRHYDYPFLCNDNELKKLQYFYDNPKDYLLYQNEEQVVDYLVQDTYKTYVAQDLSNSLRFLNLNYFIILSLLLLFF